MAVPTGNRGARAHGGAHGPEGARLLDDLHDRDATGRHFLARNYYVTVATAG